MKQWRLRNVALLAAGTLFVLLVIAYSLQRAMNDGLI